MSTQSNVMNSTLATARRAGVAGRSARVCLAGLLALAAGHLARAEMPSDCGVHVDPPEIVRRINEIRAHGKACRAAGRVAGVAPLLWSERLATAALAQAREMALQNRMSHRDRRDRSLAERLRDQGYRYVAAAENVAVGYASFDEAMAAWLESEGHCENLMSGAVVESGLACADGGDSGPREEQRYWTLVLGAPAR